MRLTDRLAEADLALFHRWTSVHSPFADDVLPRLTRAADNSRLWFATAAVLAATGGIRGRRAAARGLAGLALTSATANGPLKWAVRRRRPPLHRVPLPRQLTRQPASSSFPSGHAASAAAFATGVALEWPLAGVPIAAVAAGVAFSRVHIGVHYPGDVAAGVALGAAAGLAVRRAWPVRPAPGALAQPLLELPTSDDGSGLVVLTNSDAGSRLGFGRDTEALLTELLPKARVVSVEDWSSLDAALEAESIDLADVSAIGVAGGDGTVSVAAGVAADHGLPLLVLPTGTLNHFARELGLVTTADAIAALRTGTGVHVDLGDLGGTPFLNTASAGGYPRLVATRERFEERIGKWPALVLALAHVLRRGEPLEVDVDGTRRRVWLLFVGNGRYHPAGFGPSWRERLDDGLLDVRVVDADEPAARTRLLVAVLTGRLGRCRAYEERRTEELRLRGVDGAVLHLAHDGEADLEVGEVTVRRRRRALAAYALPR